MWEVTSGFLVGPYIVPLGVPLEWVWVPSGSRHTCAAWLLPARLVTRHIPMVGDLIRLLLVLLLGIRVPPWGLDVASACNLDNTPPSGMCCHHRFVFRASVCTS